MVFRIIIVISLLLIHSISLAQMIDLSAFKRFTHVTSTDIADIQELIPAEQVNNPVYLLEQVQTKMGQKLAVAAQQGKSIDFTPKESIALLISDLATGNLISKKCKQWLQKQFESKAIFNEYGLVIKALEYTGFERGFNERAIKKYMQDLVKVGVMQSDALQKIIVSEITQNFDFFPLLNKATLLDYRKANPEAIQQNYVSAVQKVGYLLSQYIPNLAFEDVNIQIKKDIISGVKAYSTTVVVSFKALNNTYAMACFQGVRGNTYKNEFIIDQSKLVQLFNKVLLDLGRPERLYLVEKQAYTFGAKTSFADKAQFGVILLNTSQFGAFFQPASSRYTTRYMLMSFSHDFMPQYSTQQINIYIEGFKNAGIFKNLSKSQISEGKKLVQQSLIYELNDIICCFKALVLSFDLESAGENRYKALTQEMVKISKGDFDPKDIVDAWSDKESGTFDYGFKLGKNQYITKLKAYYDWIDPKFVELIQTALTKEKSAGNFYQLAQSGQSGVLMYLTSSQYNYLKANKLVKFKAK